MTDQNELVFEIAHGDIGTSRYLRKSLEIIRSASDDPQLQRSLDDVLAGRTSVREFGACEAFARFLDRFSTDELLGPIPKDEGELERLAQQGNAILEALSHGPSDTGSAESTVFARETASHEDDDYYFDEHRRNGWLR